MNSVRIQRVNLVHLELLTLERKLRHGGAGGLECLKGQFYFISVELKCKLNEYIYMYYEDVCLILKRTAIGFIEKTEMCITAAS